MARKYNYIFRKDDPAYRRKMEQRRKKDEKKRKRDGSKREQISVRVEETGNVYSSIAEAARDLGINASNISKVISGQRKTAGGFHFQRYVPDDTDYDTGGAGFDIPEPAPEPSKAERLRSDIRQKIDRINKLIQEARERGREGFLDDLNDLADFASSILGETGDNLIDDQSDVLDDMDDDELERFDDVLTNKLGKAEEDVKKADDRLQGYADAFGSSAHEMEKYEHLIPEINRTLERAQRGGEGSNLWYAIKDAIARGVDPEDIEELLRRANDFFDNPERGDSLRRIIKEWEDETYHGDSWEDLEDDEIY